MPVNFNLPMHAVDVNATQHAQSIGESSSMNSAPPAARTAIEQEQYVTSRLSKDIYVEENLPAEMARLALLPDANEAAMAMARQHVIRNILHVTPHMDVQILQQETDREMADLSPAQQRNYFNLYIENEARVGLSLTASVATVMQDLPSAKEKYIQVRSSSIREDAFRRFGDPMLRALCMDAVSEMNLDPNVPIDSITREQIFMLQATNRTRVPGQESDVMADLQGTERQMEINRLKSVCEQQTATLWINQSGLQGKIPDDPEKQLKFFEHALKAMAAVEFHKAEAKYRREFNYMNRPAEYGAAHLASQLRSNLPEANASSATTALQLTPEQIQGAEISAIRREMEREAYIDVNLQEKMTELISTPMSERMKPVRENFMKTMRQNVPWASERDIESEFGLQLTRLSEGESQDLLHQLVELEARKMLSGNWMKTLAIMAGNHRF